MFDQYSYKQKFFALVVLAVIMTITAYKRSFSVLWQVITEYNALSTKVNVINEKAGNLYSLQETIESLDQLIGKQGISKEIIQQEIVNFTTTRHAGVSINALEPIHLYADENHNIITNQLDVTGNVNQLIKLAYDYEKNFMYSRVVNMHFYLSKRNSKSDLLHFKIIFQNYEKND